MADTGDVDELFKAHCPEDEEILTPGEAFVRRIEEEYTGFTPEQESRNDEKKKINDAIKELEQKIRMCPNIKNHRMKAVNDERAKKRKQYKLQIDLLKLRLDEIKIEEGSKVDEKAEKEKAEREEQLAEKKKKEEERLKKLEKWNK